MNLGFNEEITNPNKLKNRLEQRRYARRARINKRVLIVTVLLLMFLSYVLTPLSRVNNPKIQGNIIYTSKEIFTKAGINSNDFLYTLNTKAVENKLKQDPFINNAKVFTTIFNCTILIDETIFVGYQQGLDKTYFLSNYHSKLESEFTENEKEHLLNSNQIPRFSFDKSIGEVDFNIIILNLASLDFSIRQMITAVNLYNDNAKIVVLDFVYLEKQIHVVIESEKIATVFKKNRAEHFLKNAKEGYYRYGIDPKNFDDILFLLA